MLDLRAADGVAGRTVRILYGEGDRYGCWLDVLADNIVWHPISNPAEIAPAGMALGQPAPNTQQVRRYPLHAPAGEPGAGGRDMSSSATRWPTQAHVLCTQNRSCKKGCLHGPKLEMSICLCRM